MCATSSNMLGHFLGMKGAPSAVQSSGGALALPLTQKAPSGYPKRTASTASFMALFGPQAEGN